MAAIQGVVAAQERRTALGEALTGDLILKDPDNFREADSELFNRHWNFVEFFDDDLGDGYGESYFYQRWAVMTEAAGKTLTEGDYGTLAMLLEKIAQLEGREG